MAAPLSTPASAAPSPQGEAPSPTYRRFRDLPRDASTNVSVLAPPVAQSWAQAIVRYWKIGIDAGHIDPAKPLYLFDFAPGDGRQAWLLLQTLHEHLAASAYDCRFCYVACSNDIQALDAMATHPYFAEEVNGRRFDTACLPVGEDGLTLRAQGKTLQRIDNPVTLLNMGGVASLPCDLYGVQQGQVVEAWLKEMRGADNSVNIEYEWRTQDLARLEAPYRDLLGHYLKRFTGTPFLVPIGAIDLTQAFATLSEGRYLFLSADYGCHTEQQVRLRSAAPPQNFLSSNADISVNYHALSIYQQQQGAWTWNHQLREDGLVLHAAWRAGEADIEEEAFHAVISPLTTAHPDDFARFAAMTANPAIQDSGDILALLRLSHHDPQVLQAGMPLLRTQAASLGALSRREWQSALVHAWGNHFPSDLQAGLTFDIAMLAGQLGHWQLSKTVLRTWLAVHGGSTAILYHLAWGEAVTGDMENAIELLSQALELEPEDPYCRDLHRDLSERQQNRAAIAWFHPDVASDEELILEPLGMEHADNFFYQYRDRQIGEMTRLPELETPDETQRWIEEQLVDPQRHNYAVIHRDWGFVGVVGMRCAEAAGYFHFWIGSDFQDRGWGQKAARLLFRQAIGSGLTHIFTSVYDDNARSQNALTRLGFSVMELRAHDPDHDLLFLHLPLVAADEESTDMLLVKFRALCKAIECPFVFVD